MVKEFIELNETRQLLTEIIAAQDRKESPEFDDRFNEQNLNKLFMSVRESSLGSDLDILKMVMFIHARYLKSQLMKAGFAEGKKRGTFFQFTVSIFWRKNDLKFTDTINHAPEQCGRLDGIYWAVRKGRKSPQGEVKYFYERITNKSNSFQYSRRSFKGAKDWELDLIMLYEQKFALIRKMSSDIAEMQRKGFYLQRNYDNLINLNNHQEPNPAEPESDMVDLIS